MITTYPWLFKPDNWETMNASDQFISISRRMDKIYSTQIDKSWRRRYATEEQFGEEYSPEHEQATLVAFQILKKEYEDLREYVLSHDTHKHNANVEVLEKILQNDVENILLEQI